MFKNKLSQLSLHWYKFGNISDQNFVIWVIYITIEKKKRKRKILFMFTHKSGVFKYLKFQCTYEVIDIFTKYT